MDESEEITFSDEIPFSVVDRDVSIFYLNENESTYIEKYDTSSFLFDEENIIDLNKPYEIIEGSIHQDGIAIFVEQLNFFKHITIGEELL